MLNAAFAEADVLQMKNILAPGLNPGPFALKAGTLPLSYWGMYTYTGYAVSFVADSMLLVGAAT